MSVLNLNQGFYKFSMQVANYCSKRIHEALAEEIEVKADLCSGDDWQKPLERALFNCFLKVDAEISGTTTNDIKLNNEAMDVVAPETVGSTAVVTLVCRTHIVVANCGDSRAVLCRGKQVVPLSVDHKVSPSSLSVTFSFLRELGVMNFLALRSLIEKMNMQE
ncbi:Protein phosphatase 2C 56 [Linum perenne]